MRRAGVTRCGTMSFVAAIGRGPRGLEPLPSSLDRRPARDYVGAHGHEALAYGLDVAGGERLRFSGPEVLVKASAETTGGAFSIVEEISPLDTPRHVHEREDELFFMLEGEHVFEIGDKEFRLGPGGLAFGPRGIPTPSDASSRARDGRSPCAHPRASRASFASSPRPRAQGRSVQRPTRVSERYGVTWL
jgi:mannose-6-phosphate isomerase-like protein (cupin superfamily)